MQVSGRDKELKGSSISGSNVRQCADRNECVSISHEAELDAFITVAYSKNIGSNLNCHSFVANCFMTEGLYISLRVLLKIAFIRAALCSHIVVNIK